MIMGVVIMELNSNWKWIVLTKLQLSCNVYIMSCNFATHAICLLEFTTYKYSELQVFIATHKLSCKANYKTPFFLIVLEVMCNFE
jgi:hypothetical protein